jgi:hypothetical protein
MKDWLLHLKSTEGKLGEEFDITQLAPGDLLKVVTLHTDYLFTVVDNRHADLVCSRPDRPVGRILLMGCTFGESSSIKPNHLFCGGEAMTHITTAIRAIYWRRESSM